MTLCLNVQAPSAALVVLAAHATDTAAHVEAALEPSLFVYVSLRMCAFMFAVPALSSVDAQALTRFVSGLSVPRVIWLRKTSSQFSNRVKMLLITSPEHTTRCQ